MAKAPYRTPGPVEPDHGELLSEHRFTYGGWGRFLGALFVGFPLGLLLLALIGAVPMGKEKDWNALSYIGCAVLFVGMPALGVHVWLHVRARDGDVVRVHAQ